MSNDLTTEISESGVPSPVTRVEHYLSSIISLLRGGITPESVVLFTPQTLSSEEKAQARENIGATDPASGLPEGFRDALVAAFSGQAFSTPNAAELIENITRTIGGES